MRTSRKADIVWMLQKRELGTRCQTVVSLSILRYTMFSVKRNWVLVNHGKQSSAIEFNYDTLWISRCVKDRDSQLICSQMKRIKNDGTFQKMYELKNNSPIKEVIMYDLPDPIFRSFLPSYEYCPMLLVLRKNNTLSRYNMISGKLYNCYHLGSRNYKDMTWNATVDQLILSTSKLRDQQMQLNFISFKIFKLHPFQFLCSFTVTDTVFPNFEHRSQFGSLRNAEIVGSFLLLMTVKNYSLLYSLEDVIKEINGAEKNIGINISSEGSPYILQSVPPLLFYTQTHFNILSFGGYPWMYIHSHSNNLLEIRRVKNGELIKGGKIRFEYPTEQKVIPDNVTFHMDESNRIIHFSTADIRVLRIKESDGQLFLHQEFHYNDKVKLMRSKSPTLVTKNGRIVKRRLTDAAVYESRALAFGVEIDLGVFFILASDREFTNGVELSRVTFYDIDNYKVLNELPIHRIAEGNIETNTFMIFMDKDVLNIVTKVGCLHHYLSYRLTYQKSDAEGNSFFSSNLEFTDSGDWQHFGPDSEYGQHLSCSSPLEANSRTSRNRRKRKASLSDDDEDWNP